MECSTPNIVWISTHDINPHLGTYEGVWPSADQVSTPRIDELAAQGLRFDHAFAAAPVCGPSRSAIMTGCYPTSIGTMHMRTKAVPPDDVRLVSEYFREAGYYTTNNWFTDFQVETPPTAFDDCSDTAHWRNRPQGVPFFSAFHSLITHESRIYSEELYNSETALLGGDERQDPAEVTFPPYHPDTAPFREAWARYYDLIHAMDAWVGSILDQLSADGLVENTLVVFWSDHGASFPRAKRWANEAGLRVPLIIRWPGKVAAGSVRREVVQMMDLAPTMLSAAGLEVPAHMHGTPLLSSEGKTLPAAQYAYGGRDRMDAQEDCVRTIRDKRFRYTLNLHPDRSGMQYNYYPDHLATWAEMRRLVHEEGAQLALGQKPNILTDLQRSILAVDRPCEELYDITADPHETRNLAEDPGYSDVRRRLRAALDEWRNSVGDLGLIDEIELLERWRPGGVRRLTSLPVISGSGEELTATCDTPGATTAWTTDPPTEADPLTGIHEQSGSPKRDGRRWHLFGGAVPPPPDKDLWIAAWRLGYAPSKEVHVPANTKEA